jgi:hypothetical protein
MRQVYGPQAWLLAASAWRPATCRLRITPKVIIFPWLQAVRHFHGWYIRFPKVRAWAFT